MRRVMLHTPDAGRRDTPRLARLTRHLNARLLDFGPGGPEVAEMDEARGFVAVRFPGHDAAQARAQLASAGVHPALEGDRVVFYLQGEGRFEDLDYVWGCLFDIL